MDLTATTPDGTHISYRINGPASGQTFVLIHSLAMTKSFWDPVVEILSAKSCVVTLDCRGHGASGKPVGPYSVEGFADDIATVCKDAGVTDAIVAGASMGGCVALAVANRHPALTSGLGLIDTTAWYGDEAEATWAGRGDKALSEGLEALVEFQKTRWFSDQFRDRRPDTVENAVRTFLENDPNAYSETCRMLGRCDLRDALSHLKIPVEIFVGEQDYATPIAMAEAMHNAMPQSNLQVYEGVRHFTPLEVPQAIADLLRRLEKRLEAQRQTRPIAHDQEHVAASLDARLKVGVALPSDMSASGTSPRPPRSHEA